MCFNCSAIDEMAKIRGAFKHLEDNTCVRFKEVPTSQIVNTHHILLSNPGRGYVYAIFACMFFVLNFVKLGIERALFSYL